MRCEWNVLAMSMDYPFVGAILLPATALLWISNRDVNGAEDGNGRRCILRLMTARYGINLRKICFSHPCRLGGELNTFPSSTVSAQNGEGARMVCCTSHFTSFVE